MLPCAVKALYFVRIILYIFNRYHCLYVNILRYIIQLKTAGFFETTQDRWFSLSSTRSYFEDSWNQQTFEVISLIQRFVHNLWLKLLDYKETDTACNLYLKGQKEIKTMESNKNAYYETYPFVGYTSNCTSSDREATIFFLQSTYNWLLNHQLLYVSGNFWKKKWTVQSKVKHLYFNLSFFGTVNFKRYCVLSETLLWGRWGKISIEIVDCNGNSRMSRIYLQNGNRWVWI